ncbi:MAG: hypothetical protein PHC34_09605 [Candidatus Gastranaerophilales bacterium]|nr:hypothetical protein [Candidatus Gastranaerophilales bacterium]
MSELKSPVTFQINEYIKNKSLIEFHTVNNEIIKGQIHWYDKDLFHLMLDNSKEITLYKNSIVYYTQI